MRTHLKTKEDKIIGLDMYLRKAKRYGSVTPKELNQIDSYFDYLESKNAKENPYTGTLENWCGVDESKLNMKHVKVYEPEFKERFAPWDTEKKYGWKTVWETVGDWRKANQIHNWFVENVQDGEDDCGTYEVSEEQVEELLDTCREVLASCELVDGEVTNGYTFTDEGMNPCIENGKVVADTSVADELLPTTSGFFFGSTDYDEYYVEDIKHTIDILEKVLAETDFDEEVVTYSSSW